MSGAAARQLRDAVWPELDPAGRLLAVPLGATEQHGPHLPLDTDTVIAVALAEELARRRGLTVAPALPVGASGEHADFPGTLSIGHAALEELLVELVRSADAWAGVVLVNWHGGNVQALGAATTRLRAEGRRVVAGPGAVATADTATADTATADTATADAATADAHAGRTETSIMLALAPERVRPDCAEAGDARPLEQLLPALRERGVRAVSPSGVLGDPAGASAEEGRRLLDALAGDLCARLDGESPDGDSLGSSPPASSRERCG